MSSALYHYSTVIYLLFALMAFSSCTKEVEEIETEQISPSPDSTGIHAGLYDSTFVFYDIEPDYVIPLIWDTLNLYASGTGSVDVDLNGSPDLFFQATSFNWDSLHLVTGSTPDQMSMCSVNTSQEFEVGLQTLVYTIAVGGHTATADYVRRYDHAEWIDSISHWDSDEVMWTENPYGNWTVGIRPIGYWGLAETIHYMAIRKNGQKLGWLEIDATDRDSVLVKSCAIKL